MIVAISTANPAVVQTTAATTWATDDQAIFKLLGTSCPLLQNRTFKLTKIDTTHFSLRDAITGANIDGATLGVASLAAGATIARVRELVTPYTGGTWSSLRAVQTLSIVNGASVVQAVLLQPATAPYVLSVTAAPTTSDYATFSIAAAGLLDGPYLDPVADVLLLTGISGSVGIVTGLAAFAATDVGRIIRIFVEPPLWNSSINYQASEIVTSPESGKFGPYWTCIKAPGTNAPGGDPTMWAPAPNIDSTARWIWAVITGFTSPTVVTATIKVGAPLYQIAGVPTQGVYSLFRLGVYNSVTGWPSVGTFHEGRLWLAGAIANRIDASCANDPFNFAPTTLGAVVLASSAISYTFNAPDVNPIYWMVPDLQGVICGTKAGEWLVQSPATGPLAPTNIAARRVTKVGCANIEPRRTEHTLLFLQAFGRKVMEYFADIYSGKFSGPHASFTWKHLTAGGVDEIAYQQELIPMLWLRVKGALVSAVYKRDTLTTAQGPTISAGAPHTLGSGRTVESISVGPSVGGNYDSLSMITNDAASGVRHVEVLTDLLDEGADSADAWFLDDAVRPSSTTTTSVASAGAPYGGMTLNGLWHLNGKTVQVWAGGVDCGNRGDNLTTFTDFLVTDGAAFVPYGDGVSAGSGAGLFTAAFAAAAAAAGTIVVGFTYNSDGQVVRPATPQESGARSGPALAKTRRADKFGLLVEGTAGLAIGTTFASLKPVLFKLADGHTTLAPNVTFTGIHRDALGDDYSFDGMACWRIARPYPANLVAMGSFLQTQDS